MCKLNVLLLDICQEDLDHVKDLLCIDDDISVESYNHPWEAIDAFKKQPNRFDLVLLDALFDIPIEGNPLHKTKDIGGIKCGLDVCLEMAKINAEMTDIGFQVPITIYSINEKPDWKEAIEKGASQVVFEKDIIKLVIRLKEVINTLKSLVDRFREFQKMRSAIRQTIAGLNVGIHIVDTNCRIWYRDDVFDRIFGDSGYISNYGIPVNLCYSRYHGYPIKAEGSHCANCLMGHKQFREQTSTNPNPKLSDEPLRISFTPTYPNGPGTKPVFKYLKVKPTYIPRKQNGVNEDEHDIVAIVEAVTEVSHASVKTWVLDQHLEILAHALQDMGFSRVRIYRASKSSKREKGYILQGLVKMGNVRQSTDFHQYFFKIDPGLELKEKWKKNKSSIIPFQLLSCLEDKNRVYDDLMIKEKFPPYTIAIFDTTGDLIGCVSLDKYSEVACPYVGEAEPILEEELYPKPDSGNFFPPSPMRVVEEIAQCIAIKSDVEEEQEFDSTGEIAKAKSMFQDLRYNLAIDKSPAIDNFPIRIVLEQLKDIIPELDMAHVRYIEGDEIVSVDSIGGYGPIATSKVNWKQSKSMSACVVRTRAPIYENNFNENTFEKYGISEFSKAQADILLSHKSHAVFPLGSSSDSIIGIVSLHAKEADYFDKTRKLFFKRVARGPLHDVLRDHMVVSNTVENLELKFSQQVAGIVIHNIQTPLAAIRVSADVLKESFNKNQKEELEILNEIDEYCDKLSSIREQFLLFFRPTDNQYTSKNILGCIKEIIDRHQRGNDANLISKSSLKTECVFINEILLDISLTVLIQNSIDATLGQNDPIIKIECRPLDQDIFIESECRDTCFAIDVEDNGLGVSKEIEKKLFKKFESTKGEGLGIGLSLTKEILEKKGGTVYYAGQVNNLTRFTLVIPSIIPNSTT